jgi:predicted nucleic acid-binding protein
VNWLLDTNTLCELTQPRPFAGLIDWLEANEAASAISTISIGEMVAGIEKMPQSNRRRSLERSLKYLSEDYAGKTLDFTAGVAMEWGRLTAGARRRGRKLSVLDSQIEATAIHFGLTLVTRNRADFFHPVFNPWEQSVSN